VVEDIRQGDIPGVQTRCRRRLPLKSSAAVWSWLVERKRLESWLADEVAMQGPGPDRLELRSGSNHDEVVERATTLRIEEPRRWVFEFRRLNAGWTASTQLTFEISPDRGGFHLSVLHEGFQRLSLSMGLTVWEAYRERWRKALAALESAVRGAGAQGS